jgi:hypothetical protein
MPLLVVLSLKSGVAQVIPQGIATFGALPSANEYAGKVRPIAPIVAARRLPRAHDASRRLHELIESRRPRRKRQQLYDARGKRITKLPRIS